MIGWIIYIFLEACFWTGGGLISSFAQDMEERRRIRRTAKANRELTAEQRRERQRVRTLGRM